MLRDPDNVKANAAATVARYHERLQAEQQARDQVRLSREGVLALKSPAVLGRGVS